MSWERLCAAGDVTADEPKECVLGNGGRVIAVRLPSGVVRVFQGSCPHQQRSLADGYVDGHELTCVAHMWTFDLETGAGLNGTPCGLAAYPTKVDGDDVLVDASGVQPIALWR